MASAGEIFGAKVLGRQMAGGRTLAEILHNGIGSIFDFRFHLEAGCIAAVFADAARINPFFGQRMKHKTAAPVFTHAAHPADFQPQTSQAGGDIQLCAGYAFHKVFYCGQIAGFRRDKHRHRFSDGDDI